VVTSTGRAPLLPLAFFLIVFLVMFVFPGAEPP
jgi:hypothetical protein